MDKILKLFYPEKKSLNSINNVTEKKEKVVLIEKFFLMGEIRFYFVFELSLYDFIVFFKFLFLSLINISRFFNYKKAIKIANNRSTVDILDKKTFIVVRTRLFSWTK